MAPNAFAYASGRTGRLIEVTDGFYFVTLAFSSLFHRFIDDFRAFLGSVLVTREKEFLPPLESLKRMEDLGDEFFARWSPPDTEAELLEILGSVSHSPVRLGEVPALVGTEGIGYAEAAMRFAMGHELGHHLLDYVDARGGERVDLQPVLAEWIEHGMLRVPELDPGPAAELDADLFAMMLVLLDLERATSDSLGRWGKTLQAAAGGAVALAALSVVGGREREGPARCLGTGDRSHPPFEVRMEQLIDVVGKAGHPHPDGDLFMPEIGREVSRHPVSFILQFWACRSLVAAVSG